ncbi:mitochondrial import inner membrane translocase subunit Tim9 [Amyelois transitella]|uniref:mitochondrial import inner membrane translocase subunit Tim9 n=1 Tax=Amyelois transitella TaxID=680683 RepID=UPI00067B1D4E|nr:mitochondrial import inner membrane translocase subunit Tim9 [Amyelois transitella]
MATPGEMSEADQIKTFKDFLVQYNKLSELCFNDCVHDFTSRTLRSSEEKCTLNCMEKYLRTNQRVSQRFHEFQMIANENMLALTQKSNPS